MQPRHDLHVHSEYSDGWDMAEMAEAAREAGMRAVGFADHCPIGPDRFGRRAQYDLSETYETRREDLAATAEAAGIEVLDGAEVNYDPRKEEEIADFLQDAGFAYTIGSIHYVTDHDIASPDLHDPSERDKREIVDEYLDWQVALIESGLFDIVGHLDLPQRSPVLRGVMTVADYRRLARALARSRTVPEINAGRLDRAYGTIHPHPDMLEVFVEQEVPFVIGSDAHAPDQLQRRLSLLWDVLERESIELLEIPPSLADQVSCRSR